MRNERDALSSPGCCSHTSDYATLVIDNSELSFTVLALEKK
jgi:hypothetical protein